MSQARQTARSSRARILAAAAAIGAALTLASSPLFAQTWDGGGANNNWNTIANWNPDGLIANDGSANLTFAGAVRLAPTLDVDYSIHGLSYTATAGAFTIGPATTRVLTLGAGGIDDQLANGSVQRINTDIVLSANQNWLVQDSNDLIVSGDINLNGHDLDAVAAFASPGLTNVTFSGVISGAGNFENASYGEVTLFGAAANTWTGSTIVQGTLGLHKTAGINAVPGNVTVITGPNSRLKWYASNQIPDTATLTVANGNADLGAFSETVAALVLGQFAGGSGLLNGTGTLTLAGSSVTTLDSSAGIISPDLKLGTLATTIDVGSFALSIISGNITQTTAGSSISKTGSGSLTLSAVNTFTGGITMQAGTLHLGAATSISTGPLTLASGTLIPDISMSLANPVSLTGTSMIAPTSTNVATLTGVVSGSGTLTVSGGSTGTALVVAGTSSNTNTGGLIITKGGVTLSKAAGLQSLGGPITIGDGLPNDGTTDATLTQTTDNQIADSATITTHTDGTYNLNGHSETIAGLVMYSGSVTLGTGTLTLASAGVTVPTSGETATASITGTGKLGLLGQTRTFDVASGKTLQIAAIIPDGGINKTGGGTLTLQATNNTYTGTTTVSGGGTLSISASGCLGNEATTNGIVLSSGTLMVTGTGFLNTGRSLQMGTATFATGTAGITFSGGGATIWNGPVKLLNGEVQFARALGSTTISPGSSLTISFGAVFQMIGGFSATSDGVNHLDIINNGQFNVLSGAQKIGNLDGTDSGPGAIVSVVTGGTLVANHYRLYGVSLSGAGSRASVRPGLGNNGVSVVRVIQPNTSSTFDLADSKMIVHTSGQFGTYTPLGTWNGTNYTGVTGYIASGRNGNTTPLWDGSGIVTTQTVAIAGNLTSIGIATAAQAGFSITGVWAGQTVTSSDTLVMYTYGGDANLDGKINIDDYVRIDTGVAAASTGWANGDFNYDGVINIDDYTTVIDANIGNQGAPFSTGSGAEVWGVVAVPEPLVACWGVVGVFALQARRMRRGNGG